MNRIEDSTFQQLINEPEILKKLVPEIGLRLKLKKNLQELTTSLVEVKIISAISMCVIYLFKNCLYL